MNEHSIYFAVRVHQVNGCNIIREFSKLSFVGINTMFSLGLCTQLDNVLVSIIKLLVHHFVYTNK